jgi:DNA polymerase-1
MKSNSKNTTHEKTVVLIDAHAVLHRAYHAMQGFATRDGRPTGAIYGLVSMILKLELEFKPDYIVACFDLPKPTFRHTSYDGYKAGRTKSEDALVEQLKIAPSVCERLHVPVYSLEGFEADDMLGTICEQLKKDDVRVIIASGDMDTLQLVDGKKVQVYTLKKGNDAQLYDREGVIARYEFTPEQIPDYKGLAGDSSDNIIGIAGIGEKTATNLIKAFGTIENMYVELKKDRNQFLEKGFKERMVKLVEEGEEDALFSKTLATIRRDAPVTFVYPEKKWLETIHYGDFDAVCTEFEFRTLKNKFPQEGAGKEEVVAEDISVTELEELRVMNNLLHSEMIQSTLEDIESRAGVKGKATLKTLLEQELKDEKLFDLYVNVEKPLIPILVDMQNNGIRLDVVKLKKLSEQLHKQVKILEQEIYTLTGETFNIASPKQMAEVLYEKLGLGSKIKKTSTGGKSTNVSQLEKIVDEHPAVKKIMEYRELTKLLSTYIDSLPQYVKEDGKIHAHFLQTGASTGRFSCEDPNLQNLPVKSEFGQKVREAFIASKGNVLLSCDYGQIDLRAAAILSGDKNLVEIFEKGIDVHTGTASRVFNVKEEDVTPDMRRKAKAINFGILYGMGVTSLKEGMGVERKEAQEFYDQYKVTFSRLMEYLEEVKASAWKKGYTETLLGRRREIPLLKSPLPFLRAQGERIAINAPIQGTSADIVKLAIIDSYAYIKENNLDDKVKLLLQIHDELVFEIKEDVAEHVADKLVLVLEKVLSKRGLSNLPIKASRTLGANLQAI